MAKRAMKTKPLTLNVEREVGQLPQPTVIQIPQQPQQQQTAGCALMQWGSLTPGSGQTASTAGPSIQLNVAPPLYGTFAGIDPIEFTQFWGVQAPNGSYPLNASVNLNINFDLLAYTNSPSWAWSFWDLYAGMFKFFVRMYSKARVVRVGGQVEECWFEVKNMIPFFGYRYPCLDNSYLACEEDPFGVQALDNYYYFFVGLSDYPLEKCLWKLQGLTFHQPGQSPDEVTPGPATPYPYGPDANFGLDMNTSIPFLNDFSYGDKIFIEGINVQVNPFWGIEQCSYNVGVSNEGDTSPDDFYIGQPGSNLGTMIPSAPYALGVV